MEEGQDVTNDANREPVWATPVHPPQPPLSIGHLMLWMLAAGLVLALHQPAARQIRNAGSAETVSVVGIDTPGWLANYQAVMAVFSGTLAGIGIASLLLAVSRKIRSGPAFPTQPGHWLLVVQGFYALASYLILGLGRAVLESSAGAVLGGHLLACLATMVLSGVACFRVQDARRWRVFLAGLAAYYGLLTVAYLGVCMMLAGHGRALLFFNSAFLAAPAALLPAAITVGVLDLLHAPRRDWLHWVGVATQILILLLHVLSYLSFHVLQRFNPL